MALLNLENIPSGQICGLSDEDLRFVTFESNERYVKELTTEFNQDLEKDNELPDLTEEQLDYLRKIEESAVPKSTANQTKQHVNLFKRFLRDNSLQENFELIPTSYLNNYLRLFYSRIRKKDGELYAPASLICISELQSNVI